MKRQYKLKKNVQSVLDTITVERAKELLRDGEDLLFINIYDELCDCLMYEERPSKDQQEILNLPFAIWGKKAGYELHRMRQMRR